MIRKKYFFLPVLLAISLSWGGAQSITLPVESISNEVGMAANGVLSILQDHTGFIWFGTNLGVVRYDGNGFTVFRKANTLPNPLSNDYVNSLVEDSSGNIWLATADGLNRFNRKQETFTAFRNDPRVPHSISSNSITHLSICPSYRETLWVATMTGGLNRFNIKTGESIRFPADSKRSDSLKSNFTYLTLEDSRKRLWVGTRNGFHRFRPESGAAEPFVHDPQNANSISNDRTLTVFESPHLPGILWIGTRGGLNRFDPDGNTWASFHPPPLVPPNPETEVITAIASFPDEPDKLLVGTLRGLYAFGMKDATWERVSFLIQGREQIETHDEYFPAIFQDRSGVLWISGWGRGLYKFTPGRIRYRFHHQPEPNASGIYANFVRSIAEDEENHLWLATYGNGLLEYDPVREKYRHLPLNPGKPVNGDFQFASTIRRTRDGSLWIATLGGLVHISPDRSRQTVYPFKTDDPETLGFSRVASITEDFSGNVWIGSDDCLTVWERERGRFKRFFHNPSDKGSLSHSHINPILEDRSGTLWIGTANGLNRYDRQSGAFHRFYLDPPEPERETQNYILVLHEDRKGRLWIGTSNGLNAMERDEENIRFRRFTVPGSTMRSFILGILEDDTGNLWLSSAGGLTRFNTKTQTFTNFDSRDWIYPVEFNYGSYLRTGSGELYFGGMWGMISFKPTENQFNRYVPPLVFSDLQINFRPASVGKGLECPISLCRSITLPHTQNNLAFACASLSYIRPEKNQYAYRLEGRDSSWNYLGYERRIYLANLLPGEYVLRVKGSNNEGIWNETGTALTIRILPAFWQTWWFKAFWIVSLIALFLIWHRARMKRLAEQIKTESAMKEFCEKHNISDREREIIQLILKGKSNREIEEALYIAIGTVKNHIYSIYQKLNVESRAQLMTMFKNLKT